MNLMITGGCGFIGTNFIRKMYNSYHKIVNYDKLTYAANRSHLAALEQIDLRYTFIQGDICDAKKVSDVMGYYDITYVIHFAAESHVDNSIKDSQEFAKTNVVGTDAMLRAALHRGVKKFVYISTDEVYGSKEEGCFNEESPFKPNSPYSATKVGAEMLCRSYYKTFGLPVTIIRGSNNMGPYQYEEKFIPKMVKLALEGKPLTVYGDGKQIRDWIYVDDFCLGVIDVLKYGRVGEAYNICTGQGRQNIFMATEILRILKLKNEVIHIDDRKGHDRRYAPHRGKAWSELEWQPRVSFDGGLRRTVNYYKEVKKP